MTIATAVVLYYPDTEIIKRVKVYAQYLDLLIIVDNTDKCDLSAEFKGIPNAHYVTLGMNKGVATALNIGASLAIRSGCSWMMMLDQDSVLQRETYDSIRRQIIAMEGLNIGLLSPVQVSKESDLPVPRIFSETEDVAHVMTSGSTLNLAAYKHCGPFEDKLFIDHVDHEYCLRLGSVGYRVIKLKHIVLEHALGEIQERKLFGRSFQFVSHRPFRSYYYVRNGAYVASKYIRHHPQFLISLCLQLIKDIVKAIIFQDKKILRLKMMFVGLWHFCAGRYGPI